MASRKRNYRAWSLVALVLAWLVPGAGHVYIGRVVRGVIIFVTISATFWAGMAMGGVMTIDRENERWWFVAEMFTGVHGLVGWRLSERVYDDIDARLANDRRYAEQTRNLAQKYNGRVPGAIRQDFRSQYVCDLLVEKSLALVPPAETVARAYAGVAGLLNLLCIFDAVILAIIAARGGDIRQAKVKPDQAARRRPE